MALGDLTAGHNVVGTVFVDCHSHYRETGPEALERIFIRDDSIGFHEEIWQHVLGCRGWLRVERHNRTHEIRSVVACRDGNGKGGS